MHCDNCLLLGYVRELREPITQQMVQQVVNDMLPSLEGPAPTAPIAANIVTNPRAADRARVAQAA